MESSSRTIFSSDRVTKLESEILNEMQRRIVRDFLDVFILVELERGSSISGFDLIGMVDEKFHTLLSSGRVYSCLYSLERDGLIEGKAVQRKTVYMLTEKGRETARRLLNIKHKILGLLLNLFISG